MLPAFDRCETHKPQRGQEKLLGTSLGFSNMICAYNHSSIEGNL